MNVLCLHAGQDAGYGSRACEGCEFAEEPGERREPRPAVKQLAVEPYTGPIPDGAVRCLRCGRPCRSGAPDPQSRMLRISAGTGYCLDCAVTDWLRNTYPVNLLVGAAPLLGTERAVADQEAWDDSWCDVDDPGGLEDMSVWGQLRCQERLEHAIGPALGGDTTELDALVAEKEAREQRRAAARSVRADRRPERKLLVPAVREVFGGIMQVAFAQARLEDIDWEWIVEHWSLPFPKGRHHKRSRGACAP